MSVGMMRQPFGRPKTIHSYNPIPNGCVLYAPFWHNNLKGPVFKSAESFGHECTVSGALWTSQGRYFAGNDHIVLVSQTALDITGYFTIEIWINTPAPATNFAMMVSSDNQDYHDLRFQGVTRAPSFVVETGAGQTTSTSAELVNADTDYHIVATYDKDAGANNCRLYLNTVLRAQGTNTGDLLDAGIWRVGRRAAALGYIGTIGEATIYNRALSATEIVYKYNVTRWKY